MPVYPFHRPFLESTFTADKRCICFLGMPSARSKRKRLHRFFTMKSEQIVQIGMDEHRSRRVVNNKSYYDTTRMDHSIIQTFFGTNEHTFFGAIGPRHKSTAADSLRPPHRFSSSKYMASVPGALSKPSGCLLVFLEKKYGNNGMLSGKYSLIRRRLDFLLAREGSLLRVLVASAR